MKSNLLILTLLLLCSSPILFEGCTPLATTSSSGQAKQLALADRTYEPEIKTVMLHPNSTDPRANLLPAVAKIGENNLQLEFDDLRPARDSYYARIVHCNQDWSQSMLQDLDFLNDFNEFSILTFEFSVDTHIPYVHYTFQLPQVKIPGNYVVVVYRASSKEDIVLSRRFMIYDTKMAIGTERNLVGASSVASLNQQINFVVSYNGMEVLNPLESVNVTIRQNQRWDNQATMIKPSFVREIEKRLEYRFFDEQKMFKGGNEFRFFDMRSLNSPGRNVARVRKDVKPYEIYIAKDKSRQGQSYAQYADLDGGYIVDNYDYRDASFSNYANVTFTLASPKLAGDVFVTGAFNYWNQDAQNRMTFDSTNNEYHATVLLRQGWYDYQYYVRSKSIQPFQLEGTHFQTENHYEIFVYYRSLRPHADLLVGYLSLEKNQR